MKKFISIFTLAVLLFNMGGFQVFFTCRQQLIRKEIKRAIKAGVPQHELTDIQVTPDNANEISWIHSREFSYRGTMYDVVRTTENQDGSITYHCITDTQETLLFAQLDELVKKAAQQKSTGNNRTESPFGILAHMLPCSQLEFDQVFYSLQQATQYIALCYSSPGLENVSPPPDLSATRSA